MKKRIGVLGTIVAIMVLFGVKLFLIPEQVDNLYVSANALYGTDTITLTEDETEEEGTANNPYVILEVVPYEGYAEIGYMVRGCEPIPMEVLAYDKSGGAFVMSTTDGMIGTWTDEYIDTLASGEQVMIDLSNPVDTDANKVTALTDLDQLGKWRNAGAAQYGYYEKVAEGTGDYYQEKRIINSREAVVFSKATTTLTGNYKWIPYIDSTKPDGTNTIRDLWDVDETWDKDRIDTYQTKYYRGKYNIEYHNKFLKEVLQLTEEEIVTFHIVVVTITPEKLSQNTNIIDKVDMISFAPNSQYSDIKDTSDIDTDLNTTEGKLVALWDKYHFSKKKSMPATSFGFNSGNTTCNDLTWEATVEILRKASIDNSIAPILFDARIYSSDSSLSWKASDQVTVKKKYANATAYITSSDVTSKGYFNNISKLFLIMEQMNPAKFYHEYIDTNLIRSTGVVKSTDSSISNSEYITNGEVRITTGYYTEQQTSTSAPSYCNIGSLNFDLPAVAWSIHTFLPYNFFADKAALENNEIWMTIGIDNYLGINPVIGNVSIRHNIFSYDGDRSLTEELTKLGKIIYSEATKDAYIYYGLGTSATITSAQAIRFLIEITTNLTYDTEQLRILEIEPCKEYIWNGTDQAWNTVDTNKDLNVSVYGSKYARQFYAKFFPHFTGEVSITKMTSSEFIGNIDDINATYDLILFGLQDGMLKTSGGSTVYNDTSLNGKIYLHNGDLVQMSQSKLIRANDQSCTDNDYDGIPNITDTNDDGDAYSDANDSDDDNDGILDINEDIRETQPGKLANYYRYSGNDITKLKYNELIAYMKAGNPIILKNEFYKETNKTEVNTTAIDPGSYMYDLANELNSSTATSYVDKLFNTEGILIYSLESKLSKTNCKLILTNQPTSYKEATATTAATYINSNNTSFRTLQYKFHISGDTGALTEYTVKLYIDVNADGKYDDTTENMRSLQIITDSGYSVSENKLKSGVNYTLTRELEADYYGVLPWKLEIVSNSNLEVRDSVIDYCALTTSPKIDLYILQIMADAQEGDYRNNLDLEAQLSDSSKIFYGVLRNIPDYTIHITSETVAQFTSRCNDYKMDGGVSIFSDTGLYKDMDMIIMGFADCYTDIEDFNTRWNIEEFIDEGRSVLFTHDTTSFVNKLKPEAPYNQEDYGGYGDHWGYGLNFSFRDLFGMDRFGAADSYKTDIHRTNANKDYAAEISGVKQYYGYIDGYSNMILNSYASSYFYPNGTWTLGIWSLRQGIYRWTEGVWNNTSPRTTQNLSHKNASDYTRTTTVSITNRGQITEYPYKIADKFAVAETHSQYYQLDMENKNIVVWYCLSDNDAEGDGIYSTTQNDVRNNYYIYNVGNITYSGVGHKEVTSEMEAKLFANTMISAYVATAKAPKIKITNKNTSMDSHTTFVYVDYDIYDTTSAAGSELITSGGIKYQLVKFAVTDNNVVFNKKLYINFTDNPTSTKTFHLYNLIKTNGTENSSDDNVLTATTVKGMQYYDIESNVEYAIAVPLTDLNTMNMANEIGVNVLITYGKKSDREKTTSTNIQLIRRGLFDLD